MATLPPLYNALLLRSDPLRLLTRYAESGDEISTIALPGGGQHHLLNEPALVAQLLFEKAGTVHKFAFPGMAEVFGNGLLHSDGDLHRSVRQATQPAFHRPQLETWKEMASTMIATSLAHLVPGKSDTELKAAFDRMTLLLVGQMLFALDLRVIARDFSACVDRMQQLFPQVDASPAAAEQFRAASKKLDRLLAETLREQPAARKAGFLFHCLSHRAGISEAQVLEELRNFLIAGSVTTSLLLATACWLLAAYPAEQRRLRSTPDAGPLEGILNETLRLYPTVWLTGRTAGESIKLGRRLFPSGSIFLICAWTLHRCAKTFPEPGRFLPERWNSTKKPPRGAFVPFSLGARNCVGEQLGRMIAAEALRQISNRFWLAPAEHQPEIDWAPRFTLWPRTGIWVKLESLPPR